MKTAMAVLGVAALLTSCGDLPRPFAGNPGATARKLAQPPPSRLAVAPPAAALLTDAGAKTLAAAVADALLAREVPAVAEYPRQGDWQLITTAELTQGTVTPAFAVLDPTGARKGAVQGAPVDAAAWASGGGEALRTEAARAAPKIADLLEAIDAERQQSDPNSLANRPARVALKGVSGSPGDGDRSLERNVRSELPKRGQTIQDTADGADFLIEGKVRSAPEGRGVTRIEIQWILTDSQGRERGRVLQINDVPAEAVSAYWGDVAVAAAQEAAGGLRELITKQLPGKGRPAGPTPAG